MRIIVLLLIALFLALTACTNEVTIPKITAEQFNIKNGDSFVSNYEFMIFSDKELNFKELEDLKNIKFEV